MSTIPIEKARELYGKIKKRKEEISNAEKGTYLTDGYFKFSQTGKVLDIKSEKSKNSLVEAYAFLLEREKNLSTAATELGVSSDNKWMGAPIDAYKSDLKLRVTQLMIIEKKQELATMEETINTLSPELLAEIQLDAIEKALA